MDLGRDARAVAWVVCGTILVVLLLFVWVSPASAVPPSVIASDGASAWTYQDLQDAQAKTEGAYAAFTGSVSFTVTVSQDASNIGPDPNPAAGTAAGSYTNQGYTSNPHGGYDTTTNKCKVCHAVHRAEGAYYLLRADSQDDACVYCHIGGSAHSSRVVYDANPAGIYTQYGHTIGAQTHVPDSSLSQWMVPVTVSTTDANGDALTAVIPVRAWTTEKRPMYRFARHHGQSDEGTGRGGYAQIGPLALRCMNCHQTHNAVDEVWRPIAWVSTGWGTDVGPVQDPTTFEPTGYKLLKRYPSGTTTGSPNAQGYFNPGQQLKVIEGNAVMEGTTGPWGGETANFSNDYSAKFVYNQNGETAAVPTWIAQEIQLPDLSEYPTAGTGYYRYPYFNSKYALSYWCADCHDLHPGGSLELANPELGSKMNTERTHVVPFIGAYSGPGQCYSCHRDNLSPKMGSTEAGGYGISSVPGYESCTQCHYGPYDYSRDRDPALHPGGSPIDFPHSSSSYKQLGNHTVAGPSYPATDNPDAATTLVPMTITADTIDAVCLRCHPGVGVHQ